MNSAPQLKLAAPFRALAPPMNKAVLKNIGIIAAVAVGVLFVVFRVNPFGIRKLIAGA